MIIPVCLKCRIWWLLNHPHRFFFCLWYFWKISSKIITQIFQKKHMETVFQKDINFAVDHAIFSTFLQKIKKCHSTLWYLCVAGVKIWRVLGNVKKIAVDHKISSMFLLYLNNLKKILNFAVDYFEGATKCQEFRSRPRYFVIISTPEMISGLEQWVSEIS